MDMVSEYIDFSDNEAYNLTEEKAMQYYDKLMRDGK